MDCRVWEALAAAERTVTWLSRKTGVKVKRFYNLKYGVVSWRPDEAEAVARALELPMSYLFPDSVKEAA